MRMSSAFPSEYLKAADLAGKNVKVKMSHVEMKDIGGDHKPILYFQGTDKGMVLNKTNANTIAVLYGPTLEDWIGERVTLQSVMVEAFGESTEAIRVVNSKPSADKATLIDRYQKLWERGKKVNMEGIENYVISPDMPADEIIALGKELKPKVEAAESF